MHVAVGGREVIRMKEKRVHCWREKWLCVEVKVIKDKEEQINSIFNAGFESHIMKDVG